MEMALEQQQQQAAPSNARDRFLQDACKAGGTPAVAGTVMPLPPPRRELPATPTHIPPLHLQSRVPSLDQHKPKQQHQQQQPEGAMTRFEETFLASGPLPQAPMISPNNPGHSVIHYDSGYQGEPGVMCRMYRPPVGAGGISTLIPSQRPTTQPPQQVQRAQQQPPPEDFERFRQQGVAAAG